ncbi:MAG: hypothetical protein J3K34DRAFT_519488 [Monoraphidium minutum]|nr:MAG: hypothetical protein J3K34DRAFT_519488 [Monoraphidium minutum]
MPSTRTSRAMVLAELEERLCSSNALSASCEEAGSSTSKRVSWSSFLRSRGGARGSARPVSADDEVCFCAPLLGTHVRMPRAMPRPLARDATMPCSGRDEGDERSGAATGSADLDPFSDDGEQRAVRRSAVRGALLTGGAVGAAAAAALAVAAVVRAAARRRRRRGPAAAAGARAAAAAAAKARAAAGAAGARPAGRTPAAAAADAAAGKDQAPALDASDEATGSVLVAAAAPAGKRGAPAAAVPPGAVRRQVEALEVS